MAKLLVSSAMIKGLLLPGAPAAWISEMRISGEWLELELQGPAVPECDRVNVITQLDWSKTTQAPTRTVTIKEV